MDILLVVVALVAAVVGGLSLSQATMGVGFLAGACLLAILARMVQASHHHARAMQVLNAQLQALSAPQTAATAPVIAAATWICMQCGTLIPSGVTKCPRCGTARPHP